MYSWEKELKTGESIQRLFLQLYFCILEGAGFIWLRGNKLREMHSCVCVCVSKLPCVDKTPALTWLSHPHWLSAKSTLNHNTQESVCRSLLHPQSASEKQLQVCYFILPTLMCLATSCAISLMYQIKACSSRCSNVMCWWPHFLLTDKDESRDGKVISCSSE